MTLTIRPMTAGDESEWRRLWTAYLEFYESAVSEEVYRTTFARLLDPAREQQHQKRQHADNGDADHDFEKGGRPGVHRKSVAEEPPGGARIRRPETGGRTLACSVGIAKRLGLIAGDLVCCRLLPPGEKP